MPAERPHGPIERLVAPVFEHLLLRCDIGVVGQEGWRGVPVVEAAQDHRRVVDGRSIEKDDRYFPGRRIVLLQLPYTPLLRVCVREPLVVGGGQNLGDERGYRGTNNLDHDEGSLLGVGGADRPQSCLLTLSPAEDLLSLVSLVHRRLDSAHMPPRV